MSEGERRHRELSALNIICMDVFRLDAVDWPIGVVGYRNPLQWPARNY